MSEGTMFAEAILRELHQTIELDNSVAAHDELGDLLDDQIRSGLDLGSFDMPRACKRVIAFLMNSEHVADVFADDEQLTKHITTALITELQVDVVHSMEGEGTKPEMLTKTSTPITKATYTTLRNKDLEAECEIEGGNAYLVYGEWLRTQGQALGELVAIQHALEQDPLNRALLGSEQALVIANAAEFFGADATVPNPVRSSDGSWNYGHLTSQWKRGFIQELYFDHEEGEVGEDPELVLRNILAAPTARFLDTIVVGEIWAYGASTPNMAHAIVDAPCASQLRTLEFHRGDLDLNEVSLDTRDLWDKCPNLERLILYATTLRLGEISFSGRQFAVHTGGLRRVDLASIVKGSFPNLEDLEIWFGDPNYFAECEIEDLKPLLDRDDLALTRLGLMNAEFGDDICAALVGTPIMRSVEVLNLSMGVISDVGVRALAASPEDLKHVRHLTLRGVFDLDPKKELSFIHVVEVIEGERYVEVGE